MSRRVHNVILLHKTLPNYLYIRAFRTTLPLQPFVQSQVCHPKSIIKIKYKIYLKKCYQILTPVLNHNELFTAMGTTAAAITKCICSY